MYILKFTEKRKTETQITRFKYFKKNARLEARPATFHKEY